MTEFNIGVHGLGWAAGAHIDTIKSIDGARVTAASSRRSLSRDGLKSEYGIPIEPYSSLEEMLSDASIDVIDICSPSQFHAEQAVQAVRAGKDLILEKPIALTYDDLLRVRNAVRENNASVCVCFEVEFSEQASTLRSAIQEDLLGDVHFAEVDYYHGIGPWVDQYSWNVKKEGGGSSLLTAGCHALDLLLSYMDGTVEEVTSYSTDSEADEFEPYEYDTTSVTILRFEDGRIGKVTSCIDCYQPYYFHMHLVGSEGSILDNKFYTENIDGLNKEGWSTFETPLVDSGEVEDHPYLPQFQAFFESLKKQEPMPLTDFETAFESHRVIFAANRSAEEGKPVQISEMPLES